MKWFIVALLVVFLVLSVTSIVISYKDTRLIDGPLVVGYPSEFFHKSSGQAGPPAITLNWGALFSNILLIAGASLALTYLGKRLIRLYNLYFN